MELGVYFDGWYRRDYSYHPSLPPRRLAMIDELLEYRATSLFWAALGGGSLSLPYLESEAFGPVDQRFRFYGYVNDSEFIAACDAAGINVYGVIFQSMAFEFPARISGDGESVLSLNRPRHAAGDGWLGLREFSQDAVPQLWPTLEHYFPGGLTNSRGEPVTDLLDEVVARDINGQPIRGDTVEMAGHDHICYVADRNNPVWREYIKAIIRIQIDAGVHGIQFDEADSPLVSATVEAGGCLCADCKNGFREYLMTLDSLPAVLLEERGTLEDFDYAEWLTARGFNFIDGREATPLHEEYLAFHREASTRHFHELSEYARDYAASKDRSVKITANLYELRPQFRPFLPDLDIVLAETNYQTYRQPSWYRYGSGFAHDKPLVVVENPGMVPGDSVVPELAAEVRRGRLWDRYRMMVYEAAALGANMAAPYGSWMGNYIKDPFWVPHELVSETQSFLSESQHLFGRAGLAEVAVIYGVAEGVKMIELRGDSKSAQPSFWVVTDALNQWSQPYDVLFTDGAGPGTIDGSRLRGYQAILAPSLTSLSQSDAHELLEYLAGGGHLVVVGEFATAGTGATLSDDILSSGHCTRLSEPALLTTAHLPAGGQAAISDTRVDAALNLVATGSGAALHMIRYDYDAQRDAVPVLEALAVDVRLPHVPTGALVHAPATQVRAEQVAAHEGRTRVVLRDLGVYAIIEFSW